MTRMMTKIKWAVPLGLLALGGCQAAAGLGPTAAGTGTGILSGAIMGLQSGGSLTPITNLGNALTLQELANSHNTIYEAQQILAAPGPVTVASPPAVVVTPAPTPITPAPGPMPVPTPTPIGPLPTGPTPNG